MNEMRVRFLILKALRGVPRRDRELRRECDELIHAIECRVVEIAVAENAEQ